MLKKSLGIFFNLAKGVSAGTMHQKIVKSAEKVLKRCRGAEKVLRC